MGRRSFLGLMAETARRLSAPESLVRGITNALAYPMELKYFPGPLTRAEEFVRAFALDNILKRAGFAGFMSYLPEPTSAALEEEAQDDQWFSDQKHWPSAQERERINARAVERMANRYGYYVEIALSLGDPQDFDWALAVRDAIIHARTDAPLRAGMLHCFNRLCPEFAMPLAVLDYSGSTLLDAKPTAYQRSRISRESLNLDLDHLEYEALTLTGETSAIPVFIGVIQNTYVNDLQAVFLAMGKLADTNKEPPAMWNLLPTILEYQGGIGWRGMATLRRITGIYRKAMEQMASRGDTAAQDNCRQIVQRLGKTMDEAQIKFEPPGEQPAQDAIVRIVKRQGKTLAITQRAQEKLKQLDRWVAEQPAFVEILCSGLIQEVNATTDVLVDLVLPDKEKILVLSPEFQNQKEPLRDSVASSIENVLGRPEQALLTVSKNQIYIQAATPEQDILLDDRDWIAARPFLQQVAEKKLPTDPNELRALVRDNPIQLKTGWEIFSGTGECLSSDIYCDRVTAEAKRQGLLSEYGMHYHPQEGAPALSSGDIADHMDAAKDHPVKFKERWAEIRVLGDSDHVTSAVFNMGTVARWASGLKELVPQILLLPDGAQPETVVGLVEPLQSILREMKTDQETHEIREFLAHALGERDFVQLEQLYSERLGQNNLSAALRSPRDLIFLHLFAENDDLVLRGLKSITLSSLKAQQESQLVTLLGKIALAYTMGPELRPTINQYFSQHNLGRILYETNPKKIHAGAILLRNLIFDNGPWGMQSPWSSFWRDGLESSSCLAPKSIFKGGNGERELNAWMKLEEAYKKKKSALGDGNKWLLENHQEEAVSVWASYLETEARHAQAAQGKPLPPEEALDDLLNGTVRLSDQDTEVALENIFCAGSTTSWLFRLPGQWAPDLQKHLRKLLADRYRSGNRKIRILSLGASTGAEAYSVAAVLAHELDALSVELGIPEGEREAWLDRWDINIVAADYFLGPLFKSARGVYHENPGEIVDATRGWAIKNFFSPYFTMQDGLIHASKRLRSWVKPVRVDLSLPVDRQYILAEPFDGVLSNNLSKYLNQSEHPSASALRLAIAEACGRNAHTWVCEEYHASALPSRDELSRDSSSRDFYEISQLPDRLERVLAYLKHIEHAKELQSEYPLDIKQARALLAETPPALTSRESRETFLDWMVKTPIGLTIHDIHWLRMFLDLDQTYESNRVAREKAEKVLSGSVEPGFWLGGSDSSIYQALGIKAEVKIKRGEDITDALLALKEKQGLDYQDNVLLYYHDRYRTDDSFMRPDTSDVHRLIAAPLIDLLTPYNHRWILARFAYRNSDGESPFLYERTIAIDPTDRRHILLDGIYLDPALRGRGLISPLLTHQRKIMEEYFAGYDISMTAGHILTARTFAQYYAAKLDFPKNDSALLKDSNQLNLLVQLGLLSEPETKKLTDEAARYGREPFLSSVYDALGRKYSAPGKGTGNSLQGIVQRLEEVAREKGWDTVNNLLFEFGGLAIKGKISKPAADPGLNSELNHQETATIALDAAA